MKKLVLCILIVNIVNVNCGLLKDVLTPVTEKVQNNALLDEHSHKEEAEKEGLLTKAVEGLDKLTEPLTGLLNQGKKDKDNASKNGPKNDTKPADNEVPDVKDKLNDTKDATKEVEAAKDNLSTTTPSINETTSLENKIPDKECKGEGCTDKPKLDSDVDVTKRINFDGSQCPTGTERAHDDTCKEVQ